MSVIDRRPYHIRVARDGDEEAALQLWQRSLRDGLWGADLPALQDSIRRGICHLHVAEASDQVVGAVLTGQDGPRRGHLYHLGVAAPWQGQGIGRCLANRAIEALLDSGIKPRHVMVLLLDDTLRLSGRVWIGMAACAWSPFPTDCRPQGDWPLVPGNHDGPIHYPTWCVASLF